LGFRPRRSLRDQRPREFKTRAGDGAPEAGSSTESWALLAKCQPGQFGLETLLFGSVGGLNQSVGKFEELLLLLLSGLEPGLDQLYDDPTGARPLALCEGMNPPGNTRRQADSLTH
jgi:hypothetical protein